MRLVRRPGHPMADNMGFVDLTICGPKISAGAAPYVISDEMSATKHMANGKMYTSKAKFRQATKDAGCVEVGNELKTVTTPRVPVKLSREQRKDDIRRAISQLR